MIFRLLLAVIFMAILTGCWNGGNTRVSLGDVSLGEQLIDLKLALESDAMTQEEYEVVRQSLLSLGALCEGTEAEDG